MWYVTLLSSVFKASAEAFASEASDKLVKVWDAYTGEIIRTFVGHTEGISDIAWATEEDFIASASDDKTVRIWNLDEVSELLHLLNDLTQPGVFA